MTTTVRIRRDRALTLPARLRARYDIRPGDSVSILDLDGIFVLTPMTPMVPGLAREIERARLEAALGVREMLADLREQRERDLRE